MDRDVEIAAFQRLLAPQPAEARTLVVSGEPGIGKTRLLAEFAQRAATCGFQVACGQASAPEQEVPFSAVAEVIISLLQPDLGANVLPADVSRGLAALLAESTPSRQRWHEFYAAVRTGLDLNAGRAGLVVLLDDLHWADHASIELLSYLMRHPGSAGVVLVLAYRPRQVPGRLAAAVAAATDSGHARELDLGPLSVPAVRRVLGPAASQRLVQQLHAESGGNPSYLQTLIHCVALIGVAELAQLPVDTDAVLGADLEMLSPAASTVAAVAATLGTAFDVGALAPVAELAPEVVSAALDELSRADVVRSDATPGWSRFRHPLVRHAVYQRATVGWRREMHARAATFYARQGAPVEHWADHLEHSAMVGDRAAAALLARAGQTVRYRTPATAARWFGCAARLLPDAEDTGHRRTMLLLARAEALTMAGRLRQGRATAGEVLARLTPDSDAFPEAVRQAAAVEQLLGQSREAAALLWRGLGAGCTTDPQRLWLDLAGVELMAGEVDSAQQALRRALAPAGADANHIEGLPDLLALCISAVAAHARGDVDAAAKAADQGGRMVDGMSDPELCRQFPALTWLGWGGLLLGRHREVARRNARAVTLARSCGQRHVLPALLVTYGHSLHELGHVDSALDCYTEAAEVARSNEATPDLAHALTAARQLASLPSRREHAAHTSDDATNSAARTGGEPPASHAGPAPVARPALTLLSPREREVADLVTQGRTNRDIATALFLSVKTVERHLCRIFCKLDISSRAALAALIAAHTATSAGLTRTRLPTTLTPPGATSGPSRRLRVEYAPRAC